MTRIKSLGAYLPALHIPTNVFCIKKCLFNPLFVKFVTLSTYLLTQYKIIFNPVDAYLGTLVMSNFSNIFMKF